MYENVEFIVEHNGCEYVDSVDTYDGDMTYTSDRNLARIFRGTTWYEVFYCRDRFRIILV